MLRDRWNYCELLITFFTIIITDHRCQFTPIELQFDARTEM